MKKIINGKKYNTDTAVIIGYHSNGYYSNNFNYVEESLYRKKTGEFFLHGEGGAMTKYAKSSGDNWGYGEMIIPLTEQEARSWAEKNLDCDEYENAFGEVAE